MFGPATPDVQAVETVAGTSTLILISADGAYWAECFVNFYNGAEFEAGMTVYDARASERGMSHSGVGYTMTYACHHIDSSRPCDSFVLRMVDRLAVPVAAVEVATADGVETRVDANDGFVLFAYEGEVPQGYPKSLEDSTGKSTEWIHRVTYFDATGEAIAASNLGPGREQVEGLPTLSKYPSRRPLQPFGTETTDWPPQRPDS